MKNKPYQIKVTQKTGIDDMRRACEMTMHGQQSNVSLKKMYMSEHSPIRCITFWVEFINIPTFVSVHLVRHKHGVEHFVKSNRDDLFISKDTKVDRNTPVNHGMFINAQSILNMSRDRLCYKAHKKTVAVWTRFKKALKEIDPDLADFMVPKCVYRNGVCPELKECSVGLDKVMEIYRSK